MKNADGTTAPTLRKNQKIYNDEKNKIEMDEFEVVLNVI